MKPYKSDKVGVEVNKGKATEHSPNSQVPYRSTSAFNYAKSITPIHIAKSSRWREMAERTNVCQRCKNPTVARCTGKVDDKFGLIWPGGKKQSGHVPPHKLLGLRENDASSDYLNFSWCLACGQIQGEWPTEAVGKELIAEEEIEDELS